MASTTWTPYGVAFTITATSGTVTRTSATKFTVKINASWKVYWSGASTNYGMTASSGGGSKNLNSFGTYASSGSGSFTGTYSISGYGAQTKSITVTFTNAGPDSSATKSLSLSVSVPAWPSYAVKYNANGGSGAPSNQTKYKDVNLVLSTTKPTRTGYSFKNWNTASNGSGTTYASGGGYTGNAALTLYAQWTANTYTVKFNANGGTGAPGNQTKTYGVALTLSTTKPTRTNYNFLGWATSASATSAQYAAGGSYTDNSAVTLYAVWELAYWKPKVTNLTISRCTSSGVADEYGTYVKVVFDWELCQLLGANNISSIVFGRKLTTESAYVTGNLTPNGTTEGTVSQVCGTGAISPDGEHNIQITVTDAKGGSTVVTRTVLTAAYTIDFLAGGKGIAIGKAATEEALDVYMRTIIRGSEDASASTASGQLIVGEPDGQHLAFDNNEIMAKSSATATGQLNLNPDGGLVSLGGELNVNGNVTISNDVWLQTRNASGTARRMVSTNGSNQTFFGYGSYADNEGEVYFDGNAVGIRAKGAINITSGTAGLSQRAYGVNKVLATTASFMTADQTITLSEAISAQPHGVIIVFSAYVSGAAQNYDWWYEFIPKYHGANKSGQGFGVFCATAGGGAAGGKYLYVYDTKITGNAHNSKTTFSGADGISHNNAYWVLRYVIGV